jgi:hypothetical protein
VLDRQRRRWAAFRFGLLAATLMLVIGALMVVGPRLHHRTPIQLGMWLPLLVGIYVVRPSRWVAVSWLAAAVLAAALGTVALLREDVALSIADVGLRCFLFGGVMLWVGREVLLEENVSLDTILGGICVYILIGFFYAHLYLMLLLSDPGALVLGGQPLGVSVQAAHPLQTVPPILYFSFTAFTTMGFGDITAASAVARFVTVTEGMLGQLYPAIFIARLVSLNLIRRRDTPAGG